MDLDRPYRSTSINNSISSSNTTSELFICFTSRLSSSSMKLSSKSILSPGHAREPSQISVSSSLNRRLRSNGSMKGGHASPMFPTNGKKKGFENPEPSSPKVTCIGQVRVKTKKQGKKFRACRSKRRGEVSFRKVDHIHNNNANNGINGLDNASIHLVRNSSHHQNQRRQQECKRWVHLPVTICEALRGFGAEFNCFLPCRSSCMANKRDSVKEKEIELVVGGEDDGERRESSSQMIMMMRSSQRRHVFEDIEINDFCIKKLSDDDEEEKKQEGRVSNCVPPKNALLLMRCRSDPVKMAALANKFWENPLPQDEQEQEEEEAENENKSEEKEVQEDAMEEAIYEHQEISEVSEMFVSCEAIEEQEIPEAEAEAETEAESVFVRDETEVLEEENLGECPEEETIIECQEQDQEETLPQVSFDLEKLPVEENVPDNEEVQQEEAEAEDDIENVSVKEEDEEEEEEEEEEGEDYQVVVEEEEETEKPRGRSEPDPDESKESESEEEKLFPDCLLLMMCEPKPSMEISKETWVCSTDYIRCVPQKKKKNLVHEVKQKDGGDQPKPRIKIDPATPILFQPRRSSCSFPIAPPMAMGGGGSMATMIEKKLVGGKGYESFVLGRCKSEPRRSAATVRVGF